jgi:membrane protease YdiL (CAAX protease family)
MTIPSEPRTPLSYHEPQRAAFSPIVALAVVAIAMASFYASQIVGALVGLPELVGLPLSFAALVGVAVVAMRGGGLSVRALGLGRPGLRHSIAALLVGATAWQVNIRLNAWLMPPMEPLQHLDQVVGRSPLGPTLLAVALLPGVCEEIVFRGVMARSLGRVMPTVVAALASAAVFSAYHLTLAQAAPTFTIGVMLGVIAQRADSAVPTMLAHILNNVIAIADSRHLLEPIDATIRAAPDLALVFAIAVLILAMALAWPMSASSRSPGLS